MTTPQLYPTEISSTVQFAQLINEFLNFNTAKSENKAQVKQIEQKLKQFSKSDQFFPTAFDFIMNKTDATYEQLFIASLLLRDKFRYQFDKYSDEESICYLENMLKQILKKYNETPPDTFSTNICVCMICLYIKRSEQLRAQLKDIAILEYFKSFVVGNVSSDYFYKALEYTPEEISSSKIVMDQVKKDRVRVLVKQSQYQVLKHLNSVASDLWQKKIIKKAHLFSALENWLSLGYKEALFKQLPNHFLVQKLFDNCLDSTVSTEATDCLRAIIKRLKNAKRDESLFAFLGIGVFRLVDAIKAQLKQYGQGNQICEAIEVVCDYGILATEFFVENYNPDVRKFLESTIDFIKMEDLDVFPQLVEFWEGFIKQIQLSNAMNNEYADLIKNVYANVCYRITWTFEMIEKMNDISQRNLGKLYNDAENISQRRDESKDFFETLALTFGQQNYLDFVLSCISQLPKNEPTIFWPYVECYLSTLRDGIKNFPSVTQSIKMLVTSYNQISTYVTIKLEYMSIFKYLMTIKQPNLQIKGQFIQHLFEVIAQNLNDPKIQERAQRAFSKGCEQNPQIVIQYIENFIHLLKQHDGNQEIVKGIMHVLGSNQNTMQKYLPSVIQVLYQVFIQANSNLKKKNAYHSLFALLKILMTYKNKEQFKDILFEFTQTIWPQILNSLRQPKDIIYDEDPQVERAVKLVKFLMRCLKDGFISFLQSLFTTVFEAYRKFPICSYIYILEVSITVYSSDASLHDYFRTLYQNFCQITYAHLKEKDSISDYELLIDDFIGMNKRFFIYNSQIVLESGELPSLIETCINLSNVIEVPQVSKSSYRFFETIFMVYWSDDFINHYNQNEEVDKFQKDTKNHLLYSQLKTFIIPKLSEIIIKMLTHLEKVPLEAIAECIQDALMSEIKGFSEVNREIWTPILENISCEILTISEKSQIFENLARVGSADIDEAREAAQIIDRLIYVMNKRFINNFKRRI